MLRGSHIIWRYFGVKTLNVRIKVGQFRSKCLCRHIRTMCALYVCNPKFAQESRDDLPIWFFGMFCICCRIPKVRVLIAFTNTENRWTYMTSVQVFAYTHSACLCAADNIWRWGFGDFAGVVYLHIQWLFEFVLHLADLMRCWLMSIANRDPFIHLGVETLGAARFGGKIGTWRTFFAVK